MTWDGSVVVAVACQCRCLSMSYVRWLERRDLLPTSVLFMPRRSSDVSFPCFLVVSDEAQCHRNVDTQPRHDHITSNLSVSSDATRRQKDRYGDALDRGNTNTNTNNNIAVLSPAPLAWEGEGEGESIHSWSSFPQSSYTCTDMATSVPPYPLPYQPTLNIVITNKMNQTKNRPPPRREEAGRSRLTNPPKNMALTTAAAATPWAQIEFVADLLDVLPDRHRLRPARSSARLDRTVLPGEESEQPPPKNSNRKRRQEKKIQPVS